MKIILILMSAIIGVSCFAEVFDYNKSRELFREYYKKRDEESKNAYNSYLINTEFNSTLQDSMQVNKLAKMVENSFRLSKEEVTKDSIINKMDSIYVLKNERARERVFVIIVLNFQKYEIIEQEIENFKQDDIIQKLYVRLSQYYLNKKNYDKCIYYAEKVEPITKSACINLQKAYSKKKMYDKAFEAGEKLFIETYVSNPKDAIEVITKMMNHIPQSYTNERVASFLEKVGKKYPAPGSNFEEWKSFMGFVGFRYKALTGKDLFSTGTK